MNRVFYFFIDNYKLSLVIMIIFVVMGLQGMNSLRRESRPPVDFATATVVTIYPGSSAAEVEDEITRKIEDEIRQVDGIKDVSSISQSGRSKVTVRVDMDSVNTDEVMNDLQQAVQRTTGLPADIQDDPVFTRLNAKEIPILEMTISGSNDGRMRDYLAYILKEELEDVTGVSEVRFSGYREREFQIFLKPDQLRRYHVGINEVVSAVSGRTKNIPAGTLKLPNNQKLVRVMGQVQTAEEMGEIVVRSNFSGQKILIKDVADVADGMEDATILTAKDGVSSTMVTVSKKANSDAIKTVAKLKDTIAIFRKTKLPQGYTIDIFNDESKRIQNQLGIVSNNAIGGLALVLIILLLFLPGWLGLATSLSLPIALLGTVGLMPLLGVTFNTVTMLAFVIAIGMLVDNAVVISENYARLRQEGVETKEACLRGVKQFWVPLTATILTTIAAFLPMLVTKGVMGQFIMWIPIMVTIALAMSLFESFFLLPARLQWTIRKVPDKKSTGTNQWFIKRQEQFQKFMEMAINNRYKVCLTVTVILFSSILLAAFGNRFELFPASGVEQYNARFEVPINYTLEKTDEKARELSKKVQEVLGSDNMDYVISRTGVYQTDMKNGVNGDYLGMLQIIIPSDIAKEQDPIEVLKKLRSIEKGDFTELTFAAQKNGPPVGSALDITFRSNYTKDLRRVVDEFKTEVSKIEGVVDLQTDEIPGGPEFKIVPDFAKIASMNLSTEKVGTALRTALQGAIVSELSQNGVDFDLRVRYGDKQRATLNSIKNTFVMDEKSRKLIPLMSVVKMIDGEAPEARKHFDFKRSITVSSDVDVTKITSIQLNKRAQKIINNVIKEADPVSYTYGGEGESTKESMDSLFQAMVLSGFGIFGILVFLFRSFLRSALILTSIPLSLVGVSLAFFLHNRPLSFLAMIGIVGLAGVVVNAAIVLVSYIDELIADGMELKKALSVASSHRLRPVIVTSLTTVVGLFPSAYGIGGSDEMLVPMTLALAWGLVSGTLLALIWVPCGYAIIEDYMQFLWKVIGRIKSSTFYLKSRTLRQGRSL